MCYYSSHVPDPDVRCLIRAHLLTQRSDSFTLHVRSVRVRQDILLHSSSTVKHVFYSCFTMWNKKKSKKSEWETETTKSIVNLKQWRPVDCLLLSHHLMTTMTRRFNRKTFIDFWHWHQGHWPTLFTIIQIHINIWETWLYSIQFCCCLKFYFLLLSFSVLCQTFVKILNLEVTCFYWLLAQCDLCSLNVNHLWICGCVLFQSFTLILIYSLSL